MEISRTSCLCPTVYKTDARVSTYLFSNFDYMLCQNAMLKIVDIA